MTPFDELQREHERLLEGADAVELGAVSAYLDRARAQSAQIGDPRERDQLRANLRYWASVVYDRSGTYPGTTLLPAAIAKSIAPPPMPDPIVKAAALRPRLMLPWLIGVAVVAVLAMSVVLPQLSAPSSPAAGSGTTQAGNDAGRPWALPATTDLYDKPGEDSAAQVLGQLQAGSQFYAAARTANAQWLKITTVDGITGWIKAANSGVAAAALNKLLVAAIVIVSTSTPTAAPTATAMPTRTSTLIATPDASTGDGPTATSVPPPTSTKSAQRATPTPVGQKPITPTAPVPDSSNSLPLQVNYQVVTYGPSPFNTEAWVIEIQLTATGGDNHYVFWVNGRRVGFDGYTIDGVACRAVTVTLGATSGGQAVRRDVTLKSPLTTCK